MKKLHLLIIAICLSIISTFKGFSQTSYYAADIVKVDPQNEIMYSILNGKVVVFDIKTQQLLKIISPNYEMSTITTIDLNLDKLAFVSKNECCIVDLNDGTQVFFKINEEKVYPHQVHAKLSVDNSKIYIAREKDKSVKVYDAVTGKLIEKKFTLGESIIYNMAMSPDRRILITTTADFTSKNVDTYLTFWDITSANMIKKIAIPGNPISVKFNGDGSLVGAAFQMSDIKKVSKKPIDCDGTIRKFELGIWIIDTESKKLVNELPIFSTYKGIIRDFEFDYNNPNLIYSIYDSYKELFSYNISTNEVKQIYGPSWFNLGFYKDYLITIKYYNAYDGINFVNTKEKEKDLLFKHIDYEPFYIDENFKNSGSASPFLFVMYNYNSSDVKWLFINKQGDYDCYGNIDEWMRASYFKNIKPINKKQGLLKEYSNPDFDRKLAQFLFDNKWDGNRSMKEIYEYSGIPFDYYEIFKMKRPEVEVPDKTLTDQEWNEQFELAKETLLKNGFTIVDAKLSNGSNYIISATVDDQTIGITCVAFSEGGPAQLIIDGRPYNARKEIELKKEKGMKLYSTYNISEYKPGKYVYSIYGSGKTFLIVATKKGTPKTEMTTSEKEALIIENTKKDMEKRGYKIVETRTATVGYGNPLIIPFEYGGEFAWTAISSDKCGAISVFTNGVTNGQAYTKEEFSVNSGSVSVPNRIEFRSTVIQCNSAKITFIIGVK